ncbi:unnamed protein product, partial [Ectocarpus sp. 13 AM-2016]
GRTSAPHPGSARTAAGEGVRRGGGSREFFRTRRFDQLDGSFWDSTRSAKEWRKERRVSASPCFPLRSEPVSSTLGISLCPGMRGLRSTDCVSPPPRRANITEP